MAEVIRVQPAMGQPSRWDNPGEMGGPAAMQSALLGGAGGRGGSLDATAELREQMREFIQKLLSGLPLNVVLEDGETDPCKLTISKDLQQLQLQVGPDVHDIWLRDVQHILPGRELDNIATTMPLDDLCNTMVLQNNECVTFRFANLEERDTFAKCMKISRLAIE